MNTTKTIRTCGECDNGVVLVDTNCGGCCPGGHEPTCGVEPCPNGCWERPARLNDEAADSAVTQ